MNPRCSSCPLTRRQVPPHGKTPSRFMLIGESPDARSEKYGRPFCGPAGQEQDETYMKLAGLDRSDFYTSVAVQCRQERNGSDVRPSEKLLACCSANHLPQEIEECQPEVIVLAGAPACSLVGKQDGRAIDLELEHGFPRRVENVAAFGGWSGVVVPMYHPAAGMHDSARYMTPLLADWERLGLWLRGKWELPKERPLAVYNLITSGHDILALPDVDWVAVDTESDEGNGYSIQVSAQPGNALMVLRTDAGLLYLLAEYLNSRTGLILHNAAYDLEELSWYRIRPKSIRDTMQELYHLAGAMPQGLKAAVYRAFGFRMTSYDEVVTPHSKAKLESWLYEALAYASTELGITIPHPPGPNCPTCGKKHRLDVSKTKPHECEAVLRRIIAKVDGSDDDEDQYTYDPWQKPTYSKGVMKARLLGRDWLEDIEKAVGRMPRPSIVHAPLDRQIQYGCGDADWTGRLAKWLEAERARIVANEWNVGD